MKKIDINKIYLEEKTGQLFFPAAFINDNDREIREIENLITNFHVGGLTFFHSRASAATNFEGKKKVVKNDKSYDRLKELVKHYQSISRIPLLMSIDAEWGLAMRVENTPQYPFPITLGAIQDNNLELITQIGQSIGNDLKSTGIHLNLAPVVDINDNPRNPVIGYRSFGDNKYEVSRRALAFYNGLKASGILGCFKHFPGHGNTTTDSHLGLPVISRNEEELWDNELFPFQEAVKAEAHSIMIGHLAVPALSDGKEISATLSKEIITGLLRKKMGYKGLIISDALNMHSVSKIYKKKGDLEWKAFEAGNDVLCFSENVEEGISTILKNSETSNIEESFERLMKLKIKAGLFENNLNSISEEQDFEDCDSLNKKLAEESISILKNEGNLIPFSKGTSAVKISIGETQDYFTELLSSEIRGNTIKISNINSTNFSELEPELSKNAVVIISLFPPSVKPPGNFGLSEELIQFLAKVFKTNSCILILFGNPYVLNGLQNKESLKSIIWAGQDFKVFQETTANIFLGKRKTRARLPVKIEI